MFLSFQDTTTQQFGPQHILDFSTLHESEVHSFVKYLMHYATSEFQNSNSTFKNKMFHALYELQSEQDLKEKKKSEREAAAQFHRTTEVNPAISSTKTFPMNEKQY